MTLLIHTYLGKSGVQLLRWAASAGHLQQSVTAAAYSTAAAVVGSTGRDSEQASTSGRGSAEASRPAGGKPTASAAAASPASAATPSREVLPTAASGVSQHAAAVAASHFGPSRLRLFAERQLRRELMLKLQPRSLDRLPRVHSIELSILAAETQLERDVVEKKELLLYALALEQLTGVPASFLVQRGDKKTSPRATGVAVLLDGSSTPNADTMYSFLEKLAYMLLPSQVGFEGVSPPAVMTSPGRKPTLRPGMLDESNSLLLDINGKLPDTGMPLHAVRAQIGNLLQYPDFERNFTLFEPLKGVRVRIAVEAASPAEARVLLSGLSIPVQEGEAEEEEDGEGEVVYPGRRG